MNSVPFNRPFLTGKELEYIAEAVHSGKLSGNGKFGKLCQSWFETRFGVKKALLTSSCTDALEMTALLARLEPGDEVIVPSYTFVSTANAFVLRGAKIVFADSEAQTPNMDVAGLEGLISPRTKAVVPMHYGGVACDMDPLLELAKKHEICVIEDAAQAIGATYKDRPLGSIGDMGTFSFHETKNIISGEGGMLAVNDENMASRAEILWEKGTNRAAFWRGEVDKYNWVDVGSSYLASELVAAFLWAQLEQFERIQAKRLEVWNAYREGLQELEVAGKIRLPYLPDYASNNAHLFYILCADLNERTALIEHLKKKNINAVFHYISLHSSPYYKEKHNGRALKNSDRYSETLLRLPMYYEITETMIRFVIDNIIDFYCN